jgi:hypothetical protein
MLPLVLPIVGDCHFKEKVSILPLVLPNVGDHHYKDKSDNATTCSVTFIFIMTVSNNGKNKCQHCQFYLYNESSTMERTSGNIGTFIFIMMVTNNGKNKW